MLDKLTQLHKSKFVKCFLIAIVLVFSYEVSKPKAFVPLAWAGYILAGMAAEQLVTMGVKGVSKAVVKKQADNYAQQVQNAGGFNFVGANPYRNKDGSITLSPTANDRAKLAGLIAGAGTAAMLEGFTGSDETGDKKDLSCTQPNSTYKRVIGNTSLLSPVITSSGSIKVNAFGEFQFNDSFHHDHYIENGKALGAIPITAASIDKDKYRLSAEMGFSIATFYAGPRLTNYLNSFAVFGSASSTLCGDGELFFPSTIDRVYPAPMDMSSTYQMPNNDDLANKPIIINNVLPPSENEGYVSWQDIENFYNGDVTQLDDVFNQHIDKQLNGSVVGENVYNIGEINNIYTDIGRPEKVEEFEPEIGEKEEELPSVPGDNLPTVPITPPPVSELDHSMWQVMRNTYNYLDDGIDSSLAAMKGITDSASGITNYLGQTMGWLPAEWRAVFTSAFVLGVFAHFLRR